MEHAIGCRFDCPCGLCKILGEQPEHSAAIRLIPRVINNGAECLAAIPPVYEGRVLASADQVLSVPSDPIRGLSF